MAKFIVDSIGDEQVTLRVVGANYRNTFRLLGAEEKLTAGQRVRGVIHAPAWKAEAVSLGGNYVEPLVGRPRRMQGTVLEVDATTNELLVHVGYDVTVRLPEKYQAAAFGVGTRIGWDNVDVPTFTVEG